MSEVPAINYCSRDFESIKEALKAHIQTKFGDHWRDFYESQTGMMLVEITAYVFDILSFYTDFVANESFLPTAQDRSSIVKLGQLVGYNLRPPTGAAVTIRASIGAVQAQDVIIASGMVVQTAKGVVFRTLIEQRISVGDTQVDITMSEGEWQTDNFTSDGTSFQRFKLSTAEAIQGSITVTVSGEEWDEMDSLVYGDVGSKIYAISYDEDDFAYITFGDDESGAAPADTVAIVVTYRIGGGESGNIYVGEIDTSIQGTLEAVLPETFVTVTLYNTERGSGGEARETIPHAKLWIPRWVKTNQRAVTEEDFDTLGNTFNDPTFGAPAFVKAKLKQDIPELNTVELYVWGRDSGSNITTASVGLKNAIETYFSNNGEGAVRLICTDVEVLDGEIVHIDILVDVTLLSDFASSDVISGITAAFDLLLSSSYMTPGADLRLSRIYDALHSVAGVDHGLIVMVIASTPASETVDVGDGVTTHFTGTLLLEPKQPVTPHSVSITDDTQTVTDDGDGNLIGDVDPTGTNTIDYDTGEFDVTFAAAPVLDDPIVVAFMYILDYQRGEVETSGDGATRRFTGAVDFPPVLAYDVVTAQKGIAFSDGSQVVIDDGDGNLIGDVDVYAAVNYIDYDTGAYDFTFALPPSLGATIRSTYRQLLRTPSEDIPIDKLQVAVKNRYEIATS